MKLLIILALVAIAAAEWTPKPKEQLRQERLNCMQEVNLSEEMKQKVLRFEYPDNEMIRNFVLCGGRVYELWDDSKGWMVDRIMMFSKLNDMEVRQSIEACLDDNSQGSPLNEWAYRNFMCMTKGEGKKAFSKIMGKPE